jgi:hypothetical protein
MGLKRLNPPLASLAAASAVGVKFILVPKTLLLLVWPLPSPHHQRSVAGVKGGGANAEPKDASCTSGPAVVGEDSSGDVASSTPTPTSAAPPTPVARYCRTDARSVRLIFRCLDMCDPFVET